MILAKSTFRTLMPLAALTAWLIGCSWDDSKRSQSAGAAGAMEDAKADLNSNPEGTNTVTVPAALALSQTHYDNPAGSLSLPESRASKSSLLCLTSFKEGFCDSLMPIYEWYNAKTKSHLYIPFGKQDCSALPNQRLACGEDILDTRDWKVGNNGDMLFRAPSGSYQFEESSDMSYLKVRRYTNPVTGEIAYSNQSGVSQSLLSAGFSVVTEEPFKLLRVGQSITGREILDFVFWKVTDKGVEWARSSTFDTCKIGTITGVTVADCMSLNPSTMTGLVGFGLLAQDASRSGRLSGLPE